MRPIPRPVSVSRRGIAQTGLFLLLLGWPHLELGGGAIASTSTSSAIEEGPLRRLWLQYEAQSRDSDELRELGVQAYQQRHYALARYYFRNLAERGDVAAETLLGIMRANGQGIAQNDALAAAWFLRASRQGYAPAQLALAKLFMEGRGVFVDLDQALHYAKAAEVQKQPGAHALAREIEARLVRTPRRD